MGAKFKSIFIDEGEDAIEVEHGVADEVKIPLVSSESSIEGVFALPSSILYRTECMRTDEFVCRKGYEEPDLSSRPVRSITIFMNQATA